MAPTLKLIFFSMCILTAGPALAETWMLQNVVFNDGAILSGSFNYEDGLYSDISITTTTSGNFGGFTYSDNNFVDTAGGGSYLYLVGFGEDPQPSLWLSFQPSLGGGISLPLASGPSGSYERLALFDGDIGRWLLSGSVVPISDTDGDGVDDLADNCPVVPNIDQANADGVADGGDACDSDDDNDGWEDFYDNCPTIANPGQADDNANGIGNLCEIPGCS